MELLIKIVKYSLVLLAGLLVIFFLNQIVQFSILLNNLHVNVGNWFLLAVFLLSLYFLGYSYYKIKHYPVSLDKPEPYDNEALENYKLAVIKRLGKNKILRANGIVPKTEADIPEALALLNNEAEKVIRDNASWVFVSTAISQNGKLDGLITLFIQLKMIYRISKIYYQKPRLKELYKLYSNVIVAVFLTTQIEELNISEHLEPIVSKFTPGKMIAGVPGIGQSIGLLTNMLFEGSANCFLTLRIGLITKEYSDFLNFEDNHQIRRNCTKEAAGLLGKIISNNSGKITRAFIKVVKNIGTRTVRDTSGKLVNFVKKPFQKEI